MLFFEGLQLEKADIVPDGTLRFTMCKEVRVQRRQLPSGGPHEVETRGSQWPDKMDLGPTKFKKQKCL